MFIGVAIFVGGMIAFFVITRYFKEEQTVPPDEPIPPPANDYIPILKAINKNIESQMPEGKVYNRKEYITSAITMLYDEATDGLNWTSFDLSNDGPNPVYFSVNDWEWAEAPLPVGQTINIDLKKRGAIKKLYLKCDTGETANVSFYIMK